MCFFRIVLTWAPHLQIPGPCGPIFTLPSPPPIPPPSVIGYHLPNAPFLNPLVPRRYMMSRPATALSNNMVSGFSFLHLLRGTVNLYLCLKTTPRSIGDMGGNTPHIMLSTYLICICATAILLLVKDPLVPNDRRLRRPKRQSGHSSK